MTKNVEIPLLRKSPRLTIELWTSEVSNTEDTTSDQPAMNPEIDLYCERTSVGIWDEPLGLVTNAAFLVAAFLLSRITTQSVASRMLIGWLAAIGIGSGLFHAFANRETLLMDVIPIQGFILTAIWVLYLRHLRWPMWSVVMLVIVFIVTSGLIPSGILNGSMAYVPAWMLLVIAAWLHPQGNARTPLIFASLLFPVSLGFRSIDQLVCDTLPMGTHFLWHLCNAIVLYWIVRAHQRLVEASTEVGHAARGAYTSS